MSHYIETPQASYGGSTGLSNRQRWEIAVGVIVVVALAIAAFAYVNSNDSPVTGQAVQPSAQSYAGVDDLATRPVVPAQSYAGSDDLATRFAASEAIRYAGADDLATRSSAVGASEIVAQSILDALEERSGAVLPAVVGMTGSSYAGVDDLATRFVVSEAIRYAGIDDLATRLTGRSFAESDDLATR